MTKTNAVVLISLLAVCPSLQADVIHDSALPGNSGAQDTSQSWHSLVHSYGQDSDLLDTHNLQNEFEALFQSSERILVPPAAVDFHGLGKDLDLTDVFEAQGGHDHGQIDPLNSPAAVPEPASVLLLASVFIAVAVLERSRRPA